MFPNIVMCIQLKLNDKSFPYGIELTMGRSTLMPVGVLTVLGPMWGEVTGRHAPKDRASWPAQCRLRVRTGLEDIVNYLAITTAEGPS
jgi:hypothetical protein